MSSHKKAQLYHTHKRFLQHFNFNMSVTCYKDIIRQIKQGESMRVAYCRKDNSERHIVKVSDFYCLVAYDLRTKKVCTVLPRKRDKIL